MFDDEIGCGVVRVSTFFFDFSLTRFVPVKQLPRAC